MSLRGSFIAEAIFKIVKETARLHRKARSAAHVSQKDARSDK